MCSSCAHGGLQNKMNWNTVTKPWNQQAIIPTRKSRISAFQGALIEGSSPVLSWDMVVLIQKNWKFGRFVKNAKNSSIFHTKLVISRLSTRLEHSIRALWKAQILLFQKILKAFRFHGFLIVFQCVLFWSPPCAQDEQIYAKWPIQKPTLFEKWQLFKLSELRWKYE